MQCYFIRMHPSHSNAMFWLIDLYVEFPNFDGPNDNEETNVGKNEYHFSRVIGYEELTVKISKKSGPPGCVASLVSNTHLNSYWTIT